MALQLAGTVHLALVQHAYCAEHGEAVDVHHTGHAAGTPAAPGLDRDRPKAPDEGAHDHCRLDEDRSTQALVVHAALVGPHLPAPQQVAPPYAPDARVTPRFTQLLAPKTSPPA